eukprot:scaffold275688_cov44-Attheya_sp.AAC.2
MLFVTQQSKEILKRTRIGDMIPYQIAEKDAAVTVLTTNGLLDKIEFKISEDPCLLQQPQFARIIYELPQLSISLDVQSVKGNHQQFQGSGEGGIPFQAWRPDCILE